MGYKDKPSSATGFILIFFSFYSVQAVPSLTDFNSGVCGIVVYLSSFMIYIFRKKGSKKPL